MFAMEFSDCIDKKAIQMSAVEKRQTATRQRKSTLTQQQKNKKRQRATPQQLSVLRTEFLINSTPNAKTREEIGQRIDMTERSVQIWFQNKRAKAKQFGRHKPGYPINPQFSNSPYTPQGMSPISPGPTVQASFQHASNMGVFDASNKPVQIDQAIGAGDIPIPCNSLNIGSWRRISTGKTATQCNLHVTYSMAERTLCYTMFADFTGFQMKMAMDDVQRIHYSQSHEVFGTGEMQVQLLKPPTFFIQSAKTMGQWAICADFSEMKQASYILDHKLHGPELQMHGQLALLAQTEPDKVTGLAMSGHVVANTMPISQPTAHFLSAPAYTHSAFARLNGGEAGWPGADLVTKSEMQSPVGLQEYLANPDEKRSMSVPVPSAEQQEDVFNKSNYKEDDLFNLNNNIFALGIENSESDLDFSSPLFDSSKDWNLGDALSASTTGDSAPEPESSPEKKDSFSDEFIDFSESTTIESSASMSTSNNDSFGFSMSPTDEPKNLMITHGTHLAEMEGNDFYLFDEPAGDKDPNGTTDADTSTGDSALEIFNGDSVLLTLIA